MEQVLIVGETGTTGKKIVNLVKASQYSEPVAMVRKKKDMPQFNNEGTATVMADLEQDVSDTVKGMDKVVFAAGSGGKMVVDVDQEGAKKMVDAAKAHNIKKIVMLSSMGADQPEKAKDLQDYLKAKHQADEYLRSSNLCYAIISPGSLTNDKGSGKIKLAKSLNISGSISRDDVTQTLVRALHDDTPKNANFEILDGDTPIGKAMEP